MARVRAIRELNGGTSLAETAYTTLRAAIQSGRFKQGQRLLEAETAEWLGISRTPVRDALNRLESDGLLISAPRRGLIVPQLDQQQVSELYAVREVLEGLAARFAAQHATRAEVAAMRDLIGRQKRARPSDVGTLAKLNTLFHEMVSRSGRNRFLTSILDGFENSLILLPGTTYSAPGRSATALSEHTALLEAIEKRNANRAEEIARNHIRAAERIRLLMVSGGPERELRALRPKSATRGRIPSKQG